MTLDSILAYDATGGGTMLIVAPTSFTIKGKTGEKAYIVAYSYDGISAEEVTITNTLNSDWPAAGFSLKATSDGTAISAGENFKVLSHKIPVKAGDVLAAVCTSGANPAHLILYVDYLPFSFKKRLEDATEEAVLWTRSTVAGGTNCAGGTLVRGATNLGAFTDHVWTPVGIDADAAFTTTAFLGIRKNGGSGLVIFPIGLTDVANDWESHPLPHGLFTIARGEEVELWWSSVTAEQPTAKITFARAP